MVQIDRCVCRDRTFDSLNKQAEANGIRTLSSLQKVVSFGDNCELCHPYVREMLRTGQTVFTQIITDLAEEQSGSSAGRSGSPTGLSDSALEDGDVDLDVKPEEKVD
jgi:bacterioferritin-associated ferredoxin